MVKVAIAGATGGLGAIILSAILNTRKHQVVALSRIPNPSLTAKGVDVRPLSYTDHASLTAALRGVHTVLSVIGSISTDEARESQLAVIAAAKEAGVKRFAPSEYAIRDYGDWDFYAGKIPVWEATEASGMEYTQFTCGIFMNTLGTGTPNGETEALGGLRPWTFVINMKAGTADLPGDGNTKVTFTRTHDIGKLVAAALDLERWEDEMGMVGSTMSYKEVVSAIEKVTKRKMLVKEQSERELKKMIREDEGAKFYSQVRLSIAQGGAPVEPTFNKLAPEIKPWTVEQYLERYWSGVELGEAAWVKGNIIM
ncbi:MAG: hypothetical protein ASARMPRED_000600 [Alectoria sarmentosa]|nr:MAG: hypothetical protein ASARMPRED_000600 [Alectoria sarmentosa]